MRILLFLCLLLLAISGQTEIYKWVDSKGEVHYSDTPTRDAEQIKLSDPTIYTPIGAAASTGTVQTPTATPPDKINYSSFVIVAPGNNETVRANDGTVTIQFQIQPGLQAGDYIVPVVDGRVLRQRLTHSVLTLEEMDRGTHMVHASIYNAAGQVQVRSNIIQFFVQRISVIKNAK